MSKDATARFVEIAKLYVAKKARTSAATSLRNIAHSLNRAVRYWRIQGGEVVDWAKVSPASMQALLSHGVKSTGVKGNDFAIVRALYRWGCHVARLPDFNPHVLLEIQEVSAPGNVKGQRVLSSDPDVGDFSPDEVELLDQAIREGKGELRDLVVVQLFHELGLRPVQLLRTRRVGLRKFKVNVVEGGVAQTLVRYTIDIPLAKRRGEDRVEESRPISSALGRRLEATQCGAPRNAVLLFWWLEDKTSTYVANIVQRWVDEVGIISPRTEAALRTNPTRFRYSIATEAARDGASKLDVAHLLFQTDTQNVQVYFDAAGTVMDHIEAQLENAFGSSVKRFLGKLCSDTDAEPHSGLPRRVVPGVFPQLPTAPSMPLGIGACGKDVQRHGVCKLAPPITCYRCPKFAAFREADHKAIGDALESMVRTRFGGQADARIGGELLQTIRAIRDLQHQIACEELPA